MKEIDNIGLELCKFQGNLFEESIDKLNCSSTYFIKIFMNSDLAFRMDNNAFILESKDINSCFEELEEKNKLNKGKEKYQHEIMLWIGYIYRYFSYTYGFNSKRVYKIIKPKELYGLYDSYHSLDPKEAISRIIESKKIEIESNLVLKAMKFYL